MSFQAKLQQEYQHDTRDSGVSMFEWMRSKVASLYPNAVYNRRMAARLIALEDKDLTEMDKNLLGRLGLEKVCN